MRRLCPIRNDVCVDNCVLYDNRKKKCMIYLILKGLIDDVD